jgi:hypothetical protein
MRAGVCGKTYYSAAYGHQMVLLLLLAFVAVCRCSCGQCSDNVEADNHGQRWTVWFLLRERVAASHTPTRLAAVCHRQRVMVLPRDSRKEMTVHGVQACWEPSSQEVTAGTIRPEANGDCSGIRKGSFCWIG